VPEQATGTGLRASLTETTALILLARCRMMHISMTTLDDVLTPQEQPLARPRRRAWARVLAGFALGFLLCVVSALGALLVWDAGYEGRILPGVSVGGVDVSGLDHEQAWTTLEDAFRGLENGRVIVRTAAGDVVVPYSTFDRRADVEAMVDSALQTGRIGGAVERAVAEVRMAVSGVSLAPHVTLDDEAFAAEVSRAVAVHDRLPIDGAIAMTPDGIMRTLARSGRTFDGDVAAAAALPHLRLVDAPAEIVVEAPMIVTPPTHGDDEVMSAQVAAQRMIGDINVTFGEKEWRLKAATVGKWLRFGYDAVGRPWPTVDESAIGASLKKIKKDVRRAPVSAKYLKTRSGRVVGVVAGRDGRELDSGATAAAIAQVLEERARGAEATSVKVVTTKIAPKLSTAAALEKGPLMVRLGSWKTWFPISDRNYFGANIWQPAKIIDGTVLQPGQRFEWWSAIGPVSPARGFGPGGFIAGDHTEPTGALGGGMCSSSTTLFNAALRAGLQMGARSNHRYYIDRYPLGLDATVSKTRNGSQTLTFTNDMNTPVVIRTFRYRSGGRGWVRYEIWGVPDGRKVTLSKPAVANLRKATTKTVYVSTLRKGVREQIEYPSNGMDVSVSRVVRSRSGRVIHSETYRSHYALWNGIIEIGR